MSKILTIRIKYDKKRLLGNYCNNKGDKMAVNKKCPKCGSNHVQLSNERSKHGCFWTILLGWIFIFWLVIKWMIGCMILCFYDWWMAIIKKCSRKGHVWQCRKWLSGNKRVFYCHDCGYNFKA